MRFKRTSEILETVRKHETDMFFNLKNVIQEFETEFKKYQCELHIKMKWHNLFNRKNYSGKRIPLKNGYTCIIEYAVVQNGKVLKLICNDGEVDYDILANSTKITEITNMIFYKNIEMYDVVEDFKEELCYFLEMLSHYHLH